MNAELQRLTSELRKLKMVSFSQHNPQETAANIRTQKIKAKKREIDDVRQRASAIDLPPHSL